MDFISERQSMADNFVEKTESLSNYMVSSRASRRRNLYQEASEAEEQIEEFKNQIQKKFIMSVSNKIYTFPFTVEAFENIDDEEQYRELIGVDQYALNQNLLEVSSQNSQNQHQNGQYQKNEEQFRLTMATLMDFLNEEKEKLSALSQISKNANPNQNILKRSQKKDYLSSNNKVHGKQSNDDANLRKRLYTQPYDKPMGFIIKKK